MKHPPTEPTIELLQQHRDGDQHALDRLLRRYEPIARRIAAHEMGVDSRREADLQDVVQDALTGILGRLDDFEYRHEGAFQAYLARAIKNRVRDRARARSRRRETGGEVRSEPTDSSRCVVPESHDTSPSLRGRISETRERLAAALPGLSPTDREIVRRVVVEGEPVESVAADLEWKVSSVRSRLSRRLAELSAQLIE